MKNLFTKIALTGALIFGLNNVSSNLYAQTSKSSAEEEAYANLKKGEEVIGYAQVALAYFDSSATALNGKNPLIQKMNLSLGHLEKSEIGLNLFIKKSKNYQPYENKELNFSMSFESRLDTNEVKQLLLKIKKLQLIESKMLNNPNMINELSLELLTEKYNQGYEMINEFLKEEEKN